MTFFGEAYEIEREVHGLTMQQRRSSCAQTKASQVMSSAPRY